MSLSVSRTLLGLSLIALFTYTLFAGLEMPFRASMLPVLASGLALPLTLLAIYIERKTENERQTQADESSGDLAVSEDEVSSDAFRRVRYFFIWFTCLIASAHLLGFLIGLPLMVLIYLLAHREPQIIDFSKFNGFGNPLRRVSKRSGPSTPGGCPDNDAVWRLNTITREET